MPPLTTRGTALDRRLALKLLAGAAAAATTRCSPPDEPIIPYVDMPEGILAGEPVRFATTLCLSGYGRGFLGITVDGRPIKIEGNPRHPFSLGATDVFAEAEVLSLYDAERSTVPRRSGQIATWDSFVNEWRAATPTTAATDIALVSGRILSPTTLARIAALRRRFPQLRWYRYEPVNDDSARAGAQLGFGHIVQPMPRWAEADVVLSLGADFLGHGPQQLHIARAVSSRRARERRQRMHVVEPTWTLTGAAADFRLPLPPPLIAEIARLAVLRLGGDLGEPDLPDSARAFAEPAISALLEAPGRALVVAGEAQPPEMHAVCHWLNDRLQAPIDYLPPPDPVEASHADQLTALAEDLHAGQIEALIIVEANPVYDAPDRLDMAEAVKSVPFSAHLGLYGEETAQACRWQLPLSHPLESWGDARAPDGTASLVQPLIERLYDTRSRDEFLALLAGEPVRTGYELTRMTWRSQTGGEFENWWRAVLHDGFIPGSAATPLVPPPPRLPELPAARQTRTLSLLMAPDASLWDGRFANNAWLQECPQPFTKQVWGNAVRLAPGDANRIGAADEDTIQLRLGDTMIETAAIVMPGQAEGIIAASWGQGHRGPASLLGAGVGQRYSGLGARPFARMLEGVELVRGGTSIPFHSTQTHTRLQGPTAELFQVATLGELARREPNPEPEHRPASFLGVPERGAYAWAMVVDTDACIGCNACVVACQAENNVPVVGPHEISQGRDMHWLRVDAYDPPHDGVIRRGFQPVPCMHCELAPCEPVCPVAASVHDHEGLNVQVYNRCIGTRFCEANCPYKVRRFNWFAYAGAQAYGDLGPALLAQHNPDVSARPRGVMEKCNYCLQRISRARHAAEREDRPIAEGEMVTACQAACPTRAIHFGDLNRDDSDVSRLRRADTHYTLLAELNTRPRTTYLKRLYAGREKTS